MRTKRWELTLNHAHDTQRRMGREKQFHERLNLTLPEGAKEAIDSVLKEGEDRNAFVRSAIAREIRRRQDADGAEDDPSLDQIPQNNTLAEALDDAVSSVQAAFTAIERAKAASRGKRGPGS